MRDSWLMLIWIMAPHSTRRSGMLSWHSTTLSLVSTVCNLLSYFFVIVQAVLVEKSWPLIVFIFFVV